MILQKENIKDLCNVLMINSTNIIVYYLIVLKLFHFFITFIT